MLELELSDYVCLHERDGSSELSRVSATKGQLAILDGCIGCGLKGHGNKVCRDSSLGEEVVRQYGQGTTCRVDRANPME